MKVKISPLELHELLCDLSDDLDEAEHINANPDVATALRCAFGHLELLREKIDPDRQ